MSSSRGTALVRHERNVFLLMPDRSDIVCCEHCCSFISVNNRRTSGWARSAGECGRKRPVAACDCLLATAHFLWHRWQVRRGVVRRAVGLARLDRLTAAQAVPDHPLALRLRGVEEGHRRGAG